MAGSRGPTGRLRTVFIILALSAASCRNPNSRIQQRQEKFESLTASAQAIGEAWLTGSASTRYARAALGQTFVLIEQERQALASTPDLLIDTRGAELSEASERLARTVANLIQDVGAHDAASLQHHLADLPPRGTNQR